MSNKKKKGIYEKYIKRLLDIFFSGFALIVLKCGDVGCPGGL